MLPSEELQAIRATLRYVAIVLWQAADQMEKDNKQKIAVEIVRKLGTTISKLNPIGIYNAARGKSFLQVKALVEKAERNVNSGKGENP